ncbi:MAG: DNA mismatch repair protein MutS [Thaumarchaeota archaeon]|nr:DNA mismatch repair protein MutS [Nitrososphaerota archaeon]
MTFHSILFERPEDRTEPWPAAPDFFIDLNLDQVVDDIIAGREEYGLKPFFLAPLKSVGAIEYRHEIMRELEAARTRDAIQSFAQAMSRTRRYWGISAKIIDKNVKQGWFLNAVEAYCDAVGGLARDLEAAGPKSRGLSSFLEYLKKYAESSEFTSLSAETKKVRADLSTAKYCLLIRGNQFSVRKYEGEAEYSAEVERTFQKFKQGAAKDYRIEIPDFLDVNHLEEAALDFVAKLYPEIFQGLDAYCARHPNFLESTIATFDREVQFYVANLDLVAQLRATGLQFCYPEVSESKEVSSRESFDLALAVKLMREKSYVVTNDFYLKGDERILVVNGPNQGGKTTFARAFAQQHYLASLGCPVPGREARLFLFDRIFTHFEREEDISDLRSKLEDDLVRIHAILDKCTPNSIVIVNELFSSSALPDAVFLGKKVLDRIIQLDSLCIYVTFLDELSSLEKTVSMLSTIRADNPEVCTFKIVRRPADGLAYAQAIANKYQLSYERIKERIRS